MDSNNGSATAKGRELLAFIGTFKTPNIAKRGATEGMCVELMSKSGTLELFELRIQLMFKDSLTSEQLEKFGVWYCGGEEQESSDPLGLRELFPETNANSRALELYGWMLTPPSGNIGKCNHNLTQCERLLHGVSDVDQFIARVKEINGEIWWANLTPDDYDLFATWYCGDLVTMNVEGDHFDAATENFASKLEGKSNAEVNFRKALSNAINNPSKPVVQLPSPTRPAMIYAQPSERVPFDLTIKPHVQKVERISPTQPADVSMLNPEQRAAFDSVMDVLCGEREERHILITGSGGTGKTFLVQKIIHNLLHKNPTLKIACTAPTHRAVGVSRSMSPFINNQKDFDEKADYTGQKNAAQRSKNNITYITAHSLYNLTPQMNESTNWVEVFLPNPKIKHGEETIRQFDVVFFDEISMASGGQGGLLTQAMKWSGEVQYIFIGDEAQLEPVDTPGVKSPIFVQGFRKKNGVAHAALVTVMRQALDSPILSLATTVREGREYRRRTQHTAQGELVFAPINISAAVPVKDRQRVAEEKQELDELIWTLFGSQHFDENSDFARILTYNTREDVSGNVHWWNAHVRKILHERRHGASELRRIELGDKLVTNAPVLDFDDEGNKVIKFANMTELAVESFYESTQVLPAPSGIPKEWRCYIVKVRYQDPNTGEDGTDEIRVLHESEVKKFDAFQQEWKDFAAALYKSKDRGTANAYRQMNDIKTHFAGVEYNFALTVHRSQGGSFQYVIVHENNIRQMLHKGADQAAQYKPVMYVAVSRARYGLVMAGKGED